MGIELYPHQKKAIEQLKSGAILCGGVGTGKSRTALAYYFMKVCNGSLRVNGDGCYAEMEWPRDLYIITTAKKRDSLEWEGELALFGLKPGNDNPSEINIVIDSWNNIRKYQNEYCAFFIFDEQRVVGYGAWSKAFIKISKRNKWILLSATPGDTWSDYIPVFVANGFYKNKSDFLSQHAVFNRFSKYPKIDRYVGTGKLVRYRNEILVKMPYQRKTEQHHLSVISHYDRQLYLTVFRDRWDVYDNKPIEETGKLCYLLRRVVNSDERRVEDVKEILSRHDRSIIFYNFDYELDLLRTLCEKIGIVKGEWNGQRHEDVPKGDRWVYLVQYAAGAEGWNCTDTNVIIFYSQNYSYRMTVQAEGRIDRLNTKYKDLYYYHVRSTAPIDLAISRALAQKKNFNERSFVGV
jgi:hypothetical protein